MANFSIGQAELQFEAGFERPQFSLFSQTDRLLETLFQILEPYGARLSETRLERGSGSVGDFHLMCYLFNYVVTLRIRSDKVEFSASQTPVNEIANYGAAIVNVLSALKRLKEALNYRAYALAVGLHGMVEGISTHEFLSRFTRNAPEGLGPSIGAGSIMYFGPLDDRLTSIVTLDLSAQIANGLFCRCLATWDSSKVPIDKLPDVAVEFVRSALGKIDLTAPF